MRLTESEKRLIKDTFLEVFKLGKIYLFGSRVDDRKRGGDIDLYIDLLNTLSSEELMSKTTQFKIKLYDKIGEQKIDVVVAQNKERSIEKEILKTGVML